MTTQELSDEQLMKGIIQMQDIITQALQVQPQLMEFKKELQSRENAKSIPPTQDDKRTKSKS